MSRVARIALSLAALAAIASVVAQFVLTVFVHSDVVPGAIRYFSFMSNWMAIVATVITVTTLLGAGRGLGGATARMAVVPLVFIVFVLYELLLRGTTTEYGLAQSITTDLLHDVVPWTFIIAWFLLPHPGLPWRAAAYAMVIPLAYLVFGLLRGFLGGFWGYWFLNPTQIGYVEFVRNSALILLLFVLLGLVVVAIDRALARRAAPAV